MDYQEFRKDFKKHHICGGGMPLAYASWCPQCNPDSSQWEDECLRTYQREITIRPGKEGKDGS